jgi:hypothetical protein
MSSWVSVPVACPIASSLFSHRAQQVRDLTVTIGSTSLNLQASRPIGSSNICCQHSGSVLCPAAPARSSDVLTNIDDRAVAVRMFRYRAGTVMTYCRDTDRY